jgi:hypothetical protein
MLFAGEHMRAGPPQWLDPQHRRGLDHPLTKQDFEDGFDATIIVFTALPD